VAPDFASTFSDIFEDLLARRGRGEHGRGGGGGRGSARDAAAPTLRLDIHGDRPGEAFAGNDQRQIRIPTPVTCEVCSAQPDANGRATKPKACTTCQRRRQNQTRTGLLHARADLPEPVTGRGQVIEDPCPSCAGAGIRVTRERKSVGTNILAVSRTATRIRLAGERRGRRARRSAGRSLYFFCRWAAA